MTENSEDFEYQKYEDYVKGLDMFQDVGTDQDTIPEGFGEFGLELTNPIPVHTIIGNRVYLDKLRTLDGKKVEYERQGSTHCGNIKNCIDIYNITVESIFVAKLYISPYNRKNSERAPKGFILASSSE